MTLDPRERLIVALDVASVAQAQTLAKLAVNTEARQQAMAAPAAGAGGTVGRSDGPFMPHICAARGRKSRPEPTQNIKA